LAAAAGASALAPIHGQRQANQWLASVRQRGRDSGLLPLRVCGAEIDPLDALRAELNVRIGTALVDPSPAAPRTVGEIARLSAYLAKRELQRLMVRLPPSATTSGRTGRQTVLMAPRLSSHVVGMLPVAHRLDAEHGLNVVFATTEGHLEAALGGWPVVGVYQRAARETRLAWLASRRALWLLRGLLRNEAMPLDLSARGRVLTTAVDVLDSMLADVIRAAVGFKAVIGDERPDLVVVGNPYTMEGRVAARIARQARIPVAVLEHGSIFPGSPVWEDAPVDLVCAWGDSSRDALVGCGVPASSIAVTGAPKLDALVSDMRSAAGPGEYILVATSGPGDQVSHAQHAAFIELLYRAAQSTPEIRWLVKLHRKDRQEYYEAARRAHPAAAIEFVDSSGERFGVDIFDYLRRARALVTVYSTAALDAMVVGVPVVTVQVNDAPEGGRIEFMRHSRQVVDDAGMRDAARSAWRGEPHPSDAGARAYAARHFHNLGHAAAATAARLSELIPHARGRA
jgi:hypothetical protein